MFGKIKFDKIQVLVFGKNVKKQKWFHMLDIWVEMFISCLYINAICKTSFMEVLEKIKVFLKYVFTQFSVPGFNQVD